MSTGNNNAVAGGNPSQGTGWGQAAGPGARPAQGTAWGQAAGTGARPAQGTAWGQAAGPGARPAQGTAWGQAAGPGPGQGQAPVVGAARWGAGGGLGQQSMIFLALEPGQDLVVREPSLPKIQSPHQLKARLADALDIITKIPRDYKLSTQNKEYFVNKTILFELCANAKDQAGPDEWKLDIEDPEEKFADLVRLFNGERVTFVHDGRKPFKDFAQLLGITKFPTWLKHKVSKPGALGGGLRAKAPKIKDLVVNPALGNRFPKLNLKVSGTSYAVSSFWAFRSSVLGEIIRGQPSALEFDLTGMVSPEAMATVANYLNGLPISVTLENAEALVDAAKVLDIHELQKFAEDFRNKFTIVQQKLEKEEVHCEDLLSLQQMLLNITPSTVSAAAEFIVESVWVSSSARVWELASVIVGVAEARQNLASVLALLVKVLMDMPSADSPLKDISTIISRTVLRPTLCFEANRGCFVYQLYKNGIFPIRYLVRDAMSLIRQASSPEDGGDKKPAVPPKNDPRGTRILFWFLPELEEEGINVTSTLVARVSRPNVAMPNRQPTNLPIEIREMDRLRENNWELYKDQRERLSSGSRLNQLIRADDAESLQAEIDAGTYKIDSLVDASIFEGTFPMSVLAYSALCQSRECLKFLLLNHATVGRLEAVAAVLGGSSEIVRMLSSEFKLDELAKQQGLNAAKSSWGSGTATNPVQKLGSFPYSVNPTNIDLLSAAALGLHFEMFDWLLENYGFAKQAPGLAAEKLQHIVAVNNIYALRSFIDHGLTLEIPENSYTSALSLAASRGFVDAFSMLLKVRQDVPRNPSVGLPFVLQAVGSGCFRAVQIAGQCGASFRALSDGYDSALRAATCSGNLEIVQFMAGLQTRLGVSVTPYVVTEAIVSGFVDIVEFFLSCGSYRPHQDSLAGACFTNDIELFKKLQQVFDFSGRVSTILLKDAILVGADKLVAYLLENFDIQIEESHYQALVLLSGPKVSKFLELLLERTEESQKPWLLKSTLERAIASDNHVLASRLVSLCPLDLPLLHKAIQRGSMENVRFLVETAAYESMNKDDLVAEAVKNDRHDMIKLFLSAPGIEKDLAACPLRKSLSSALAQCRNEVLFVILSFLKDANLLEAHTAIIKSGVGQIGARISEKGPNPEVRGKVVLLVAKTIRHVVSFYPNIDLARWIKGYPPLYWAVKAKDLDLVRTLLQNESVDVNEYVQGRTMLVHAIGAGSIPILEAMLACPRADINAVMDDGRTVFDFISQQKLTAAPARAEMTKLLRKMISDPRFDASVHSCIDMLCTAIANQDSELADALLALPSLDVCSTALLPPKPGAKETTSPLIAAVERKNLSLVTKMINHPSFKPTSRVAQQALVSACTADAPAILGLLFEKMGSNPNMVMNGHPILDYAIASGALNSMLYILDHHQFVNKGPSQRYLELALRSSSKSKAVGAVIDVLVARHLVDVNGFLSDGSTALTSHYIDPTGAITASLLQVPGIDVNLCSKCGESPITANLAFSGALAHLLANEKVDVNMRHGPRKLTPLMVAVSEKSRYTSEALDLLLGDARVDVNAQNSDGMTALMMATEIGLWDAVKRLVKSDRCRMDIVDNAGRTLGDLLDSARSQDYTLFPTQEVLTGKETPPVSEILSICEEEEKAAQKKFGAAGVNSPLHQRVMAANGMPMPVALPQ